eukprot:1306032-Lingulodinium_polyedra.AAC.1
MASPVARSGKKPAAKLAMLSSSCPLPSWNSPVSTTSSISALMMRARLMRQSLGPGTRMPLTSPHCTNLWPFPFVFQHPWILA